MLPRNAAADGPWRSTSLESRADQIDHPADTGDGASGAFAATPRRRIELDRNQLEFEFKLRVTRAGFEPAISTLRG
jgi:hypothetical protein